MSEIGKPERDTQIRVIKLFEEELGYYYLGDWSERPDNSNIDEKLLTKYLARRGYTDKQVSSAIRRLIAEANNSNRSLYANNKATYGLMRYGVPTKTEAGGRTETVHLIDWKNPTNNDFAIAEEVALRGRHARRPDIVLYVNGLAIGVLELKNSRVSIGDGIRQNLSNQQAEFHEWFFSTVQFIFAGNDSEGLKYGTIKTPEKYFLQWKEDEDDNIRFKLDKYLLRMCEKHRLIELMFDFVLFDGSVKKLPRAHQYFGVKKAQERISAHEGGIIWHTQGSGKSIVMVVLAKWVLENNSNARVVIITDRDELDKQIERVFNDVGEPIKRAISCADLMGTLGQANARLICSLVHKFSLGDVDEFGAVIKDFEGKRSATVGEVIVFVDECHRTQSGKLHRAMKALMPNAIFIGFTGTPLLKKDKQTSMEVFGSYIHTYKFSEAVEDQVVLDLIYEARDIDQKLHSQEKVNQWFDVKTKGLSDWQREKLKKQWGTMQSVLSSRSRIERVVSDIIFDFSVKPRLSSQRGNAVLVASSIFEACRYFDLFQKTPFKGRCALVTSYSPNAQDVTKEETGANSETDKQVIFNTYTELLKGVDAKTGLSKTETYEEDAKRTFVTNPENIKLLIVVDKLLTGFDAPPCTYLYVDKSMQDHGLFQAICRTNRLDGADKDFGYIVDYKDLFMKVENAIAVYTSDDLDISSGGADPNVLLKDRLKKERERLDTVLEQIDILCEPVELPRGELEYIHYFCGNTELPADLEERQHRRATLYMATVSLLRAYTSVADSMESAGYSSKQANDIKAKVEYYQKVRETVKMASGETLDLKAYEADMRHLIDTYIVAEEPKKISEFDKLSLVELITKIGIVAAISDRLDSGKGKEPVVAETIENNVRSKIMKEHLNDPAYYQRISDLLAKIIADRKAKAVEYKEYLKRIAELARAVETGKSSDIPASLDTPGKRALFNNLDENELDERERLALELNAAVWSVLPDDWRGVEFRERIIKNAMYEVLDDEAEVDRLFLIVKAQNKDY